MAHLLLAPSRRQVLTLPPCPPPVEPLSLCWCEHVPLCGVMCGKGTLHGSAGRHGGNSRRWLVVHMHMYCTQLYNIMLGAAPLSQEAAACTQHPGCVGRCIGASQLPLVCSMHLGSPWQPWVGTRAGARQVVVGGGCVTSGWRVWQTAPARQWGAWAVRGSCCEYMYCVIIQRVQAACVVGSTGQPSHQVPPWCACCCPCGAAGSGVRLYLFACAMHRTPYQACAGCECDDGSTRDAACAACWQVGP